MPAGGVRYGGYIPLVRRKVDHRPALYSTVANPVIPADQFFIYPNVAAFHHFGLNVLLTHFPLLPLPPTIARLHYGTL